MKPLAACLFVIASLTGPAYLCWTEFRGHARHELARHDTSTIAESADQRPTHDVLPTDHDRSLGDTSDQTPEARPRRSLFPVVAAYDSNPEDTIRDEANARLIARTAIVTGNDEAVAEIDRVWAGNEQDRHAWLALKVDRLLADGRRQEAETLLEASAFEGQDDVGRLIRLASLRHSSDPEQALALIDEAVRKAPRSGDAHLFRGQLLESLSRLREARVEYVTAVAAEPDNPFFRIALGDFYQRIGNFTLAVTSYREAASQPGGADAALKVAFWTRVAARPTKLMRPVNADSPYVALSLLIDDLPDRQFWNESRFDSLPGAVRLERDSQEVYWLRVLECLRAGNDRSALAALRSKDFGSYSWNKPLRGVLETILAIRSGEEPPVYSTDVSTSHPFVQAVLNAPSSKVDDQFHEFLNSKDAFVAALLTTGWVEAALRLPHSERCSNEAPHYLAYGLTRAFQQNRSSAEAIDFGLLQPACPEIDVILGELMLISGDLRAAEAYWKSAAATDGAAGYRASWLLGTQLIQLEQPRSAVAIVQRHPDLRESVAGQELLARAYAALGDTRASAIALERSKDRSLVARVVAIEELLTGGDRNQALLLAQQLLAAYPDSQSVRALLMQVIAVIEDGRAAG